MFSKVSGFSVSAFVHHVTVRGIRLVARSEAADAVESRVSLSLATTLARTVLKAQYLAVECKVRLPGTSVSTKHAVMRSVPAQILVIVVRHCMRHYFYPLAEVLQEQSSGLHSIERILRSRRA